MIGHVLIISAVLSALFYLLSFTSGCAPVVRRVAPDLTRDPLDKVLNHINSNYKRLKNIEGRVKFTVDTPEISKMIATEVALIMPDSILLVIHGPLGLNMGSAILTRNKFRVYDRINNLVFTGNLSLIPFKGFIDVDFQFDFLMDIFTGVSEISMEDGDRILNYSVDGDRYLLEVESDGYRVLNWISPSLLLVEEIKVLDLNGNEIIEKEYRGFERIGGVYLPKIIRISRPVERQYFTVFYEQRDVNRDKIGLKFDVSSDASIIDILEDE